MRRRLTWTVVLVVVVLGAVAIGVNHRNHCRRAGEVGCTLLPWSGHHTGYLLNPHYLLPGRHYLLPGPHYLLPGGG